MTCKRHKWILIPRPNWIFEDKKTGELCTVDICVCQVCRAKKTRLHVYGPGEQVAAMLWGEQRFEVLKREWEE